MGSELPVFTKCLFCMPLRHGLIGWGCFKVTVSCLVAIGAWCLLFGPVKLPQSEEESFNVVTSTELFIWAIGVVALLDIVLSILLITGCKRKNLKVLRIYYNYSKLMVALTIGWSVYYAGLTIYNMFTINFKCSSVNLCLNELAGVLMYFATAGLHFYIMLLVRSLILKLDNEGQIKFVNNATDVVCDVDKDFNEDKDVENYKKEGNSEEI